MNTLISPLIREAERLDNRSLDALIADITSLRIRRSYPQTKEVWLLEKINKGLPISQVRRLQTLNEKRQQGTATDLEQEELRRLVEKLEKLNVNRLKYLSLLAQQRAVTVRELMRQLGIGPVNG